MRVFGNHHLEWQENNLCQINRKTPIVSIEQDKTYPTMWRVRLSDGQLTDMVNLTRARDAARAHALAILNRKEQAAQASPAA